MNVIPPNGRRVARLLGRKIPHKHTSTRIVSHVHNEDVESFQSDQYAFQNRVYLAVGSNLGDRYRNIAKALKLLCDPMFDDESYVPSRLSRTSYLYYTAPMYVTDQPSFLNGAVELETDFHPESLLRRCKLVEKELGRNFSEVTKGPRPVDLDILLYDRNEDSDGRLSRSFAPVFVDTPSLVIPHIAMQEREFVLSPLNDVAGSDYQHPTLDMSLGEMLRRLPTNTGSNGAIRVLPLPRGRMLYFNETITMGILNVTPDSFSDGGKWNTSVDDAVNQALEMESQGAAIIDIGGESTRPGAKETPIEIELERTIPVIQRIRQVSNIPISIDTRHALVAKAAVEAGADVVNDVSGGTFDSEMLPTVASLNVPIILMHMRGTPESMQELTEYSNVVDEVVYALLERSKAAEEAGIPRWLQILDPGIGFAKNLEGNLSLLKNMQTIREKLGNMPILLGTSRKGFVGKITGEKDAANRDYGTTGSNIAALCLGTGASGCNIVRVHNVKASRDATLVMDAIRNSK